MATKNWIAGATKNKGGLHRALGVPLDKPIPLSMVMSAAKRPGKVGKEARLALNLRGLHQGMPPSMNGSKKKASAPKGTSTKLVFGSPEWRARYAKKSRKSKRAATKK